MPQAEAQQCRVSADFFDGQTSALATARLVQPFRNYFVHSFLGNLPAQVRTNLCDVFTDFLDLLAGYVSRTAGQVHQLLACFFTPRRCN
jgi:hypothetical protein